MTALVTPGRSGSGLAKIRKVVGGGSLLRGIVGTALFIGLWQVATSLDEWTGFSLPIVAQLPSPSSVLQAFAPGVLGQRTGQEIGSVGHAPGQVYQV